jgi:phenylalanyl-tRNA synthetase beta chain
MLELGKPIHTFDAAAVSGGQIVVRTAHDGEKLETLDHIDRTLTPDTLVIADAKGAIGIAGVMGGAGSEVSDATTAVIVESAIFDAVSIRRTAFRYGLRSEASLRFEKGQESRLARLGADRTAQLLAEWAGGRVAMGVVDTNPVDEQPRRVTYRPSRVDRLLGTDVSARDMRDALARVGIETEQGTSEDDLVAVVPTHRRDVAIEADVAEEIVRVIGYDTVPIRLPATEMPGYRDDPSLFVNRLRDLLAARGLNEVVTNALIGPDDHLRLGYDERNAQTIVVENPISIDHSQMRRSMLPGLLGVLGRNERQDRDDLAIFEVGHLHEWQAEGPAQAHVLAMLLAGNVRSQSWSEPARTVSFEDMKGLIEMLGARWNLERIEFAATHARPGVDHPGRVAAVIAVQGEERTQIGLVLEVHPKLLAAYEVRAEHVAFALLNLDVVVPLVNARPQVKSAPALPVVERDIAVVVTRDTAAAEVETVIRRTATDQLATVALFDRYQGPPLEANQVSLAYRLRFQPRDDAPDTSLDDVISAVGEALEREVGGRIRSGS